MASPTPPPKPRDPRQPHITPDDVDSQVNEILAQPVDTLAEETAQLEAAHSVLNNALHGN